MLNQITGYQIFFPGQTQLPLSLLLSGISKKTLLRISAHLLGKSISHRQEDAIEAINCWFGHSNQSQKISFMLRAANYQQKNGNILYLYSTKSCLRLLQVALEMNDDREEDEKSESLSELLLFKALLVINDEIDKEHIATAEDVKKLYPNNELAGLAMSYSFPTYDVDNFDFTSYVSCQIIKCKLLFTFLEQSTEGKKLLEKFCKYYNVATWQEFFLGVGPLLTSWANRRRPGGLSIILKNDENLKRDSDFLKKFAISEYNLESDYDYKHLRDRPLIQLNSNEYLVTHPMFLYDKFFKGLYFLLAALNKEDKVVKGDFRQWYTKNFSEGEVFNFLFKRVMNGVDKVAVDNDFKEDGAPDGYVRRGNVIGLYESKDVLLNAKIKQSHNIQELSEGLKEKFLKDKDRVVGIGQIIANIKKILNGPIAVDNGYTPKEIMIYPFLVTHDIMFMTPGVNEILNVHFHEELKKLADSGLDISKVKDLAVVHIDTFIEIEHYLTDATLTMEELADAYFVFCNPLTANTNDLNAQIRPDDRLISFSDFVAQYCYNKFGPQWRSRKLYDELFPPKMDE